MKKIPTLFIRNPEDRRFVLNEVTPGCEWVFAGEGRATRKYDGTCVMKDDAGEWWARREVKPGKSAPANFLATETDSETGKTVGWEPIAQSPFAKYHAEAVGGLDMPPGTYELVGPKINGNPEDVDFHGLVRHGRDWYSLRLEFADSPRDYDGLHEWLTARPYEGIVWYHPDGRMAKLKRRDFPA